MDLGGRVALVTGSAVGVGRAAALGFARRGAGVVVNYNRSAAEAEETRGLCRAQGVEAVALQADVARDSECRRLVSEAVGHFGRLDMLGNNAAGPGAIDTRWLRRGLGEKGYEALVAALATTPLGVISSADDVADAILWLAAGARMTTGETVIVDGGYHLGPAGGLRDRRET